MKRRAITATLSLGLVLSACNNAPETSEDDAADDVETISLDEVPDASDIGNEETVTPQTAVSEQASTSRSADGSGRSQSASGSKLIKGGGDTGRSSPPPGSKLQKADPAY